MYCLVHLTARIGQVSEDSALGRTCLCTCSQFFALRKPRIKTKITFVDCTGFFIEIPGIIRASSHAGLAADALLGLHHYDAVCRVLVRCLCRASQNTRRIVALVAK